MVFAVVGNSNVPFSRFFDLLRVALENLPVAVECVVQTGIAGRVEGPWTAIPFLEHSEFLERIASCRVLVCHGGSGSIFSAIQRGRRPIVIPRLPELGEIVDDHQVLMSREFENMGLVDVVDSAERLSRLIAERVIDRTQMHRPSEESLRLGIRLHRWLAEES